MAAFYSFYHLFLQLRAAEYLQIVIACDSYDGREQFVKPFFGAAHYYLGMYYLLHAKNEAFGFFHIEKAAKRNFPAALTEWGNICAYKKAPLEESLSFLKRLWNVTNLAHCGNLKKIVQGDCYQTILTVLNTTAKKQIMLILIKLENTQPLP